MLLKRDGDPVDFPTDEIFLIVGAHRAAENDGAGMLGERRRQRIAKARPTHIQRKTELLQSVTDPSRGRMLLMEDDQNRLSHDEGESESAP